MKNFFFSLVFFCTTLQLVAVTPSPYTEAVTFSSKLATSGSGGGGATLTIYGEGTASSGAGANGPESSLATVWLRPGKQYTATYAGTISGSYIYSGSYSLSFTAPNGYALYINGTPSDLWNGSLPGTTTYFSFNYSYTLELRPVAANMPAGAGGFSGIDLGKSVSWGVGLGALRSGRSAGAIHFKEKDLTSGPAGRDRLYYAAPANAGQITVVKDGASNQTLRQVAGPQTVADLVDDAGGYWIKFYAPAQATWNGALYTFAGQTPWRTIRVEAPSGSQLKITETEGAAVRVSLLTLTSGSVPSGTYVWTLQEGDGSTWLRTTTRTSNMMGTSGSATGGTVTTSGGYTIHTFTGSGTFTVNAPLTADYLVVAGGGGGGSALTGTMDGGGGGAGGMLAGSGLAVPAQAHPVTVGAGGAAGVNGGNSVFYTVTATGGGRGAHAAWAAVAGSGGSGGGQGTPQGPGPGAGIAGQGNNGGYGRSGGYWPGGGGGGAGGVGGASGSPDPINGGVGAVSSITGVAVTYAGGGGGGSNGAGGAGGAGGGGAGGVGSGANGTPNTGGGGGGGGGSSSASSGGAGGSGIVVIRYPTSGSGSSYREEIVEVRTGGAGGPVVAKTKYRYDNQSWGEEVGQVVADPDSAALTTTYTYHTNTGAYGNYRRVRSVTGPTGGWTAYQYYDDWNRRGRLQYEFAPYLDAPAAVTMDPAQGRVTNYDYTADWTGRSTRPATRQERVNNSLTGQTTWSHGDIVGYGLPRESATVYSYRDASNYQTDYEEHYRGDAGAELPYRPYVSKGANQAQTAISEINGSYNAGTQTFTADGSNGGWRQLAIHGSTNGAGAEAVASWGGQNFATVYLIPNKSTMEATIRDVAGNTLRTESWVYTGSGGFALLTWENFTYNAAGRLTARVANNGATVTHTWSSGLLVSTVGTDGTETQFTYDALQRVSSTIKKGAGPLAASLTSGYSYPAQSDITSTNAYDGASRVTQTVTTAGGLTLTGTATYDRAGRVTQSIAPGGYATSYAYSAGGRIVTTTFPGGASKTTDAYLDGRLRTVSGSAVVAEAHGHWVDGSSGKRACQSVFGGNYSAWTNTYWDWLGRKIEEWTPGWNGNAVGRLWTYNSAGQLAKFSQPGVADTLYAYDTLGGLQREGLDVNANGALDLAGNDRITERAWTFFGGGAWWRRDTTSTYASSGSGSATQTAKVETQLGGFPANRFSFASSTDIFGNVATTATDVDRASKRVTTTIDPPDSNINAVQITYNGLGVEARDTVGVITRAEHDALGRTVRSIDPRTGTTTTAYVSGTSLVSSVTDPAGITQAAYTYDSAGRVAAVTNALGKVARYDYNSRNQKFREWGDTAYPVEYGYDALGRQTTMRTYRGGSGWTGASWSGSPGTADTTTRNYHAPTGLLQSKTDAAGRSVNYTYTQAGQIATRTWARGIVTYYAYSGTTAELTAVSYSDGTPSLSYSYNRLGKQSGVTDYTGARAFTYNLGGTLELQREQLGSFFGDRQLDYSYDTAAGTRGRLIQSGLGNYGAPHSINNQTYTYQTDGRLAGHVLNAAGYGSHSFNYGYLANSHLLSAISNPTVGYTDTRAYDPYHDWTDSRTTTVSGSSKAAFAYMFPAKLSS